uniref:Reverse transcriptase domain-containing protein n=1 Tax=Tanacetum cinerariifolium TaxID=118510 RepID=A0A6L2KJ01_TANCI|nr:reverse transcriptase domain-containing protein [Tanacetum cinerariifolium]
MGQHCMPLRYPSKGSGDNYWRIGEEIRMGQHLNNDEELRLNLDLLEERQERAAVCEAKSKSKMMKYYNARVRDVAFRPAVNVVNNDEELRLNLDLLEERQERVAVCEAKSKSKMMKYYNARVRGVAFRPGDFVYRSNDASYAVAGGKLGPKWEGPYEVTKALGNGAYKLRSTDGTILPRTWNVANLKRCYL